MAIGGEGFLIGAFAIVAVMTVFVLAVRKPSRERAKCMAEPERLRELLRNHPPLRNFVVANALWEPSFAGLKRFSTAWASASPSRSTGS